MMLETEDQEEIKDNMANSCLDNIIAGVIALIVFGATLYMLIA